MRLAIVAMLLCAANGYAAPVAKILAASGKVTFAGKPVASGAMLESGTLETGADGKVRLLLLSRKTIGIVNPGSALELSSEAGKAEEVALTSGLTRWLVEKSQTNQAALTVKTRSAVMGVRGTDFIASYNGLLGESEIICFDGSVNFADTASKDQKLISKGQWGGIGGRFGQKISPILDLPANVLAHFASAIPAAE